MITEKKIALTGFEVLFDKNDIYFSSHIFSGVENNKVFNKPFDGHFKNVDLSRLFEVAFILKNSFHKNSGFVKRYLDIYNQELADALVENDEEKMLQFLGSEDAVDRLKQRYRQMYTFMHMEGSKRLGLSEKNSQKYVLKLLLVDYKEGMRTMINLTEIAVASFLEALTRFAQEYQAVLIKEKTTKPDAKFVILRKEEEDIIMTFNDGTERQMELEEAFVLLSTLDIYFNRIKYQNKFDIKPFKLKEFSVRNTETNNQMIGIRDWLAPLVPVSVKLYGLLKMCRV